jgi:hypothetical protein
MQLERIAIVLRSRTPWEAVDLGFRMAAHWARPLWTLWFALFLPLAVVLTIALREQPWLAALLLWWLLPVLDRFLLHVLARSVFGEVPALAQTLSDWRSILRGGLWFNLLLRPLAWRRGFLAPIHQLEGQRGAALRRRPAMLLQRVGGYLFALAVVWVAFVAAAVIGGEWLLELLRPGDGSGAADDAAASNGWAWGIRQTVLFALALSLFEPFFVAAAFALYLNRRVQLEGWDIELGLRRLARAERRPAAARKTAPIAVLLLAGALAAALLPGPARADGSDDGDCPLPDPSEVNLFDNGRSELGEQTPPLDTEARRAIVRILAAEEFGQVREVEGWRQRKRDRDSSDLEFGWLATIGKLFANLLQGLAWVALIGLVLGLLWAVARRWQGPQPAEPGERAPARLFGLAITPESLPDDVAAAALAALQAGQLREALSLLYRGALSQLVHARGLRIGEGATEGDVLRIARRALPAAGAAWFEQLLPAWIATAYGHRLPGREAVEALCRQYAEQFGRPTGEPEGAGQ